MRAPSLLAIAFFALAAGVFPGAGSSARAAVAEDGPSIQVRARSELDGASEIVLGDIAEFHGLPVAAVRELKSIRLGDAPRRGESRSFTDVGLSQIFRARLRTLEESSGERIALTIPSKVTVSAKPLAIDAKEAESELERKIKGLCGGDCEVDISNFALPPAAASLPPGATWQIKMRPEIPRGPFSIPLEIKNGDGTRRLYWLSGTVSLRKRAPVARRAISAGTPISADDWSMETRDVTYLPDPAPETSELTSAWASRAIAPGEIIGRGAFRREAAVKAGETVRVIAGSDDWQIAAEGVAQQGGFVGETVRVKIPRTQKLISGMLKEKGVVEVQ